MKKSSALAGAGAITVAAVTGALAIASGIGIIGTPSGTKTGQLSPATAIQSAEPEATTPEPIIETVIVDVPAPAQPATPAPVDDDNGAIALEQGSQAPVIASDTDDDRRTPRFENGAEGPDSPETEHESEDEDSHSDEDDPTATGDHANEDSHSDEDD